MAEFTLPHDHGRQSHAAALHRELADTERFAAAAELFKQLGDPTRMRMFWLLSHREECVINLAALLDMSSPAVSHHLRSMTECGLLTSRRDGKEVYYAVPDTARMHALHEIVEQVLEIGCPEKTVDYAAAQEEVVRSIHAYLIEHLSERITIEELSRRFLMNPTTLKAAFKKVYGTTIAAHIRQHRMEAAAQRIADTTEEIGAIAQAVGYESQSRFTIAFKETYGVSPTEYRRQAGAEAP